ncbi:MAG: nitroreductase family deazaflavin-dependent oxidoreductase [Anaerolineae bacterium]|nr:nitroreductase family deazaflavin-dependent oxidoreductase [Anaerolineae bacterium]
MSAFDSFGKELMHSYPREDWRKALFKIPLVLWRMGLGPMMGHIFTVITTKGRKTGLARRTVAEYFTMDGKIYVACAFGPQADWYKNIAEDPYVTVQTWQGAEQMAASRVTDDEELLAIVDVMAERNPVMLDWYFKSLDIIPGPGDILANKERVYIIRFEPTMEPTLFPLEADLAWLWPVIIFFMLKHRRQHRD